MSDCQHIGNVTPALNVSVRLFPWLFYTIQTIRGPNDDDTLTIMRKHLTHNKYRLQGFLDVERTCVCFQRKLRCEVIDPMSRWLLVLQLALFVQLCLRSTLQHLEV